MLLEIQRRYTDLAFNSPNLYKYLYMTDHKREQTDELLQSLRFPNNVMTMIRDANETFLAKMIKTN